MVLQTLLYISVLIITFFILILYIKLIRPSKRLYDIFRAQGITGEPFVPIIGQLPEIRRYRKADAAIAYQEDLVRKHGNVLLFCFGPAVRLIITEPDLLADVYSRTNAQNYIKPPLFHAVFIPIIGKENLLVAEGQEHERARRMINPAFYHTNLKAMVSIITEQTGKAIIDILTASKTNTNEPKPIDLQVQLNILSLTIISSSAFGSGFETITSAKDTIIQTFSKVLDAIVYRSLRMVNQIPILANLPFWKKDIVDNGARMIAELVDQIIADRRQGRSTSMSNGPDLLDLLLSAIDDQGQPFTDQQIKQQALTFVLAGSETTGNLMSWVFYILMTHPDVLAACQEEVERVLPNGVDPDNECLSDLVICEAILNETLRLYPPAPLVARYCIHEHTIGTEHPLRIPAGATIIINNYILHRRSDLWKDPTKFDYTRWLRDSKTGLKPKLVHPYAFLPFASGTRNCIGQNFALLEAKIMLAMFVQRCNFELVPGQKIVPDFKITMRPKYGLLTKVSKR
ncbi:unnamed protein product [Adineta ricciae]|uniref:Cytochrome P450 n=1 Tax=Adineta ricciae TaxID=249248 RepID=A0A814YNV4_ADIRI|nr:unnamed protein product [Adineta ricciae]